jgi:hypothetical protein
MLGVPSELTSSIPNAVAEPSIQTNTTQIPVEFTNFFSQISSQLSNISSHFEAVETRLSKVERPYYSPSAYQTQPTDEAAYYEEMAMPLNIPDDTSEYALPTADHKQSDYLLFLKNIYHNHYDLNDRFLPTLHHSILTGEFDLSFQEWLVALQIHDEPRYLPAAQINTFFSWRLGHIELMANTDSHSQYSWIQKRDAIRAATGVTVEEQAKSGRGLRDSLPLVGLETESPSSNIEVAPVGCGNTNRSQSPPPPHAHSPNGWFNIQKGGRIKSFAAAAATNPQPCQTPPAATPQTSNLPPRLDAQLTRLQVEAMMKQQIVSLIGTRFSVMLRNTRMTKPSLINLFLSHQSRANLVDLTVPTPSPPTQQQARAMAQHTSPPRARPTNQAARLNTEFMILTHPDEVATRAKRLEPAEIVRTLRTAINQAHGGGPAQITLLSGRWSTRLSHNFVLTFAGKPTNDQVYRYCAILTSLFRSAARIVPQEGFTKVIIHSVPVERDQAGNPATTMTLINELRHNPVCEGLTFINPPQWFSRDIPLEKRISKITPARRC